MAQKLRSLFFILPQREDVFDKLDSFPRPDCYIFDLEDGVPPDEKQKARENIRKYAKKVKSYGKKVLIRINEYQKKEWINKDLELLASCPIDGVIIPMIKGLEDVKGVDHSLSIIEKDHKLGDQKFEIIPLIETTSSVALVDEIITSSSRISAISLGLLDLFNDSNAKRNAANIVYVQNKLVYAAKSKGLPVIDSPFTNVHDYSGLYAHCQNTVDLGFNGKYVIHPDHIDIVNSYFSITYDEQELLKKRIEGSNGACFINQIGEFIGPPVEKKIKRELKKPVLLKPEVKDPIQGKALSYGLDIETVFEGQMLTSLHEITVNDSWQTTWSTVMTPGNILETSANFATSIGLKDQIMPYSALINLDLCMSVEVFSESCLLHLGIYDVQYERAVYAGDTLKNYIYIEKLKNNSDGKRSIITTKHFLVNQNNERVMSLTKLTLFPHLKNLSDKKNKPSSLSSSEKEILQMPNTKITDDINLASSASTPQNNFNENELILHGACRHIGESENLMLTTLFRNSHPVHYNYLRHDKKSIIICGGFVMSLVMANALKDFKQIVDQKIISCSHINRVAPMDVLSAVSFIHEIKSHENTETLTLKTIGLINVDPEKKLANIQWPRELFSTKEMRPAKMEALLKEQLPEIFHKVCVQITWQITRLK